MPTGTPPSRIRGGPEWTMAIVAVIYVIIVGYRNVHPILIRCMVFGGPQVRAGHSV